MGNEEKPKEPETEPKPKEEPTPTEPTPKEPAEDPKPEEGGDDGDDLKDKHGQPGIAKGKYEREMAAKDAEIADLKAKVSDMSKTEEGRDALNKRIADLEAKVADEKLDHQLDNAGARNAKAVKAILGDYDGDIEKCKAANPYLFGEEKQKGSTGAPHGGAGNASLDAALEKAFRPR
jgi:hypothetical protein